MPEHNSSHNKEKNQPSIEEICLSTWKSVYRFIYFKVQNRQQAENITQETYVKAISHLKNGEINPEKYDGYLKTIAMNVLRDLWRKKKRRGSEMNIELIDPVLGAVEDPNDFIAQRLEIESALAQLNSDQRKVIELRILEGYSVADTAKIMNKKEGAIRVIQYRGLQQLSSLLKKYE